MENLNIISQSLEHYDKINIINKDLLNTIHYIRIIKTETHNCISFYDKSKNLINTYEYEILGMYNSTGNIWLWAWANALTKKNAIVTAKKILNYGLDLDRDYLFLKNELITSRFRISNPIQLDMHVAIGLYLSKKNMIFSYRIYDDSSKSCNITHNGIELKNVKKSYDDVGYNEYYLLIDISK